ncbi:MAG: hypothetical protein WBM00_08220, partial [Solirubrobacterales bacterium]
MSLLPPNDFRPAAERRASPSADELRELWERHESARRERERAAQWRRVVEEVRRDADGELRPSDGSNRLPAFLRDRAMGPQARAALRPAPKSGRVVAAGVDTWSPCWYAEPGSPLARAMRALATQASRRACLLPDKVEG